jgi:phosphomannomutase/phosphoglucomutase
MAKLNPEVIREYDIRGSAERDFTDDNCRRLGRAIGTVERRAGARRITLGRDCRLHSPRIHDGVLAGLVESGLEIFDIGVCATPLLYFSVHHWDMDGGVMVTASHNPAPDNGLKICVGKATIHGAAIREIGALVESGDFVSEPGGRVTERPVLDDYVRYVTSQIRAPKKLRIAIDAGNGPGGIAALPIFRALGHEVVELYCEPDGRFPNHHPDPTVVENLRDLVAAVRERRCDVGIAYDGDADRIGVVDESGRPIWGDQLMILFSRSILEKTRGGTFIAEVKCSRTLYDDVPKNGGRIVMWKTGHSLIKSKMKEEHALLAGEMSGHMFFADRYYGFDDAARGDPFGDRQARRRSARRRAPDPRDARDPRRGPRVAEVRDRRRAARALREDPRGDRHRRSADQFRRRLGPRPSVEHASRAGASLRGRERSATRGDPQDRRDGGSRDHRARGLGDPLDRHRYAVQHGVPG